MILTSSPWPILKLTPRRACTSISLPIWYVLIRSSISIISLVPSPVYAGDTGRAVAPVSPVRSGSLLTGRPRQVMRFHRRHQRSHCGPRRS